MQGAREGMTSVTPSMNVCGCAFVEALLNKLKCSWSKHIVAMQAKDGKAAVVMQHSMHRRRGLEKRTRCASSEPET